MAPCSLARRVITAKMLTPPDGSFGWMFTLAPFAPFAPLLHPQIRLERHQRVLAPEVDDAIVIPRLGNRTADQRLPKAPQLIAVQVVHEIEDELRGRLRGGTNTMQEQLLEHVRAVTAVSYTHLRAHETPEHL